MQPLIPPDLETVVQKAMAKRREDRYTTAQELADDLLLDIRLYSRSFRADHASIILDDLGLTQLHLRDHIAARRKFFDNKERIKKLKGLVAPNDTAADLDRKLLAVVVARIAAPSPVPEFRLGA